MRFRSSVFSTVLALAACWLTAFVTSQVFGVSHTAGDGVLMTAMFLTPFRLVAKSIDQLTQQSRPLMGQPEVIPWYWFDRQVYAAAGQPQLVFFANIPATPTLGNMELAGQLPTPQFQEVFSFHFDVCNAASALTAAAPQTGPINDITIIRRAGTGGAGVPGGTFQFELSQKVYGQFPLSAIGPAGNPMAALASGDVDLVSQIGGWVAHFGTQAPDPIVTIPPTTAFRARCRWDAVVPITVATFVEVGLWGALHRKVV